MPLGYLVQGLGRGAAGGFQEHFQPCGFQLPRLDPEVGFGFDPGLSLRPGGIAGGHHVGQDNPGSSQAAELPAASNDFVPGGRQVGGQDYGLENGGTPLSYQLLASTKAGNVVAQSRRNYGKVKTGWGKKQIQPRARRIFAE